MTLDAIAVHLVETTASSGAQYRPTPWAATVGYVVAQRRLNLSLHLAMLARRRRLATSTRWMLDHH